MAAGRGPLPEWRQAAPVAVEGRSGDKPVADAVADAALAGAGGGGNFDISPADAPAVDVGRSRRKRRRVSYGKEDYGGYEDDLLDEFDNGWETFVKKGAKRARGIKRNARGPSKYRGVSWAKQMGKYQASASFEGKQKNLGYYKSEECAAQAYDDFVRAHRAPGAAVNFPREGEEQAVAITRGPGSEHKGEARGPSKYRSVYWNKRAGKYMASAWFEGKSKTLGYYESEECAAQAYDDFVRSHYAPGAAVNFPVEGEEQAVACGRSEHKGEARGPSKYRGVCWDKQVGKYKARAMIEGKSKNLGHYESEECAAQAYDDFARAHYAPGTAVNFPGEGEEQAVARGPGSEHKGEARGPSKYRGVCWNKPAGKYMASAKFKGKQKHLGLYESEECAARAYDDFVRAHYAPGSAVNFPAEGEEQAVAITRGPGSEHKGEARGPSKYRGVSWAKQMGKYQASASFEGKQKNLGYYKSEECAAQAYDDFVRAHRAPGAAVNFPREGEEQAVAITRGPGSEHKGEARGPSKYRSVYWNKRAGKYMASAWFEGKSKTLGYYESEECAAQAYDDFVRSHYAPGAAVNFPVEGEEQAVACGRSEHKGEARGPSKYRGVCWDKQVGKYKARAMIEGKSKNLGHYESEECAAQAYDDFARAHYAPGTAVNFPGEGEEQAVARGPGSEHKGEARGPSKYRGVCWNKQKGKYEANGSFEGKQKNLGYYESEECAAQAYDNFVRSHYAPGTAVNFPGEGEEQAVAHRGPPVDPATIRPRSQRRTAHAMRRPLYDADDDDKLWKMLPFISW